MMSKFSVKVPPTTEMGSFVCNADSRADALWQYNSSRAHDGLEPVKRMPRGTKFTPKIRHPLNSVLVQFADAEDYERFLRYVAMCKNQHGTPGALWNGLNASALKQCTLS